MPPIYNAAMIGPSDDSDFSEGAIGFAPPVEDMTLWAYLGGTLEKSLKNWAPGGVDLTAFGTPSVASDHLLLTGMTHYLRTSVADSADYTDFAVAATDELLTATASRPNIMSTQNNSSASGRRMFFGAGASAAPVGSLQSYASALNDSTVSAMYAEQIAVSSVAQYRFYAVSHEEGVGRTLWDMTAGTKLFSPSSRTRTLNVGGRTMDIGSAYLGGNTGTVRIPFVGSMPRAGDDNDVLQVYRAVKAYLADLDLAV
jgi:hypothetical protein